MQCQTDADAASQSSAFGALLSLSKSNLIQIAAFTSADHWTRSL